MIVSGVSALPYDDSAGFTAPPAFGPFRVLHQIGSGVLGPVFRAFEPDQERLIAVKAFRLDIVPEVTAQLADVLRRLAATPIRSPRVVPVVAAGLEGMTAFLASEYATSDTFDVALRRIAPAPLDEALPLLRQMGEAIEAAWQAGQGHGALHPRDVFVAVETGEVSVGGFGVLPALEQFGVKAPARRPYTAPERIAGRAWDIRADVYSFGVLAHELLTGRRPAGTGEQDGALPSGMPPEQRVVIRRVLDGVLAEDPDRRYATPSAFLAALETGDVPDVPAVVERPAATRITKTPRTEQGFSPAVTVGRRTDSPGLSTESPGLSPEQPGLSPAVPATPVETPTRPPRPLQTPVPAARPDIASQELRREPMYVPPVPPPVVSGSTMALVAAALVVGAGIGYWFRGAPAAPADLTEDGQTVMAGEPPVGTDVAVVDRVPAPPPAAPAAETPAAAVVPPPAPAATRGRLLVRSEPSGARVAISGRTRGTTPATIRDLPFGTYNVTVSRAGYQPTIERVTVSRAAPVRDVTLVLRALAPAPAVSDAGNRGPQSTTGAVYIETRPAGAQVTIDGRLLGTSPMRVPDLAPGSHAIRLDLAGHKSVTTTVVVRAGQVVPVRVSLERM